MSVKTRNKLHVLFLPRWYPHRYDPMPGLFIKRHAEALTQFANISVIYVHPDLNLKENYQIESTKESKIETIRVYYRKRNGLLSSFFNSLGFLRANLKAFQTLKKQHGLPNLIHVHVLSRHALIAQFFKLKYGIPFLITEHWTRYLKENRTYKGNLRMYFTNWLGKQAGAILPVTNNLQSAMEDCNIQNSNYKVIPNVVDTDLFIPGKNKEQTSMKRFVNISCFTDTQKNISGILRVLKRLKSIHENFTFIFIGEGEDFKSLQAYAESLDLNHSVKFTGLLEGEKVVSQLQSADAMVMFSNYENLPVVILESLSCGIPVISTDTGGISEHLTKSNGELIEIGNEEALFFAMQGILIQTKEYNQDSIRQYAVDNFSKEIIGKSIYEVYLRILNPKHS